jgi:hypothetical protein
MIFIVYIANRLRSDVLVPLVRWSRLIAFHNVMAIRLTIFH